MAIFPQTSRDMSCDLSEISIDQFRYIKIQPKTIDLSTRLVGISTEFVGFIPKSLVLRSIVLGWILIYRNRSIALLNVQDIKTYLYAKSGSSVIEIQLINYFHQ